MADEIELHYVADEPPDAQLARWRSDPPAPVREGRFEVVDESYNSITYEARFYDWPQKILFVATLGFAWLLSRIVPMHSIWRFTARFDTEGERGTKVTILGKASEETRTALGEVAAEHGGSVGLRVGV